jgi:hypothetical protein
MKKNKFKFLYVTAFSALAIAITPFNSARAQSISAETTITQTQTYNDGFEIKKGQLLKAPEGKSLTMTVNGVETKIAEGKYIGKVVLEVTDIIPITFHDTLKHNFRTSVYINDGKIEKNKSVLSALMGGNITDNYANNIKIDSQHDNFNGIIVTGNSRYEINNPVIDMVGNGGNDFAGYGAAIMTSGNANVTLNNPKIRTKGVVRTAIFVGGNSTLTVNNADIEVQNGKLPDDYKFTIEVGKMMEVPWMLGLAGNVRATNLVDHGTVYYNNSHIKSQGWGVLSADDATVVRMYVKDSLIETIDSGYGAYSIGDSLDHFSNSTINVADIGLIIAGPASGTFTDKTKVNSRRYGVMMHSGTGGGLLTIDKGSEVNSRLTAIEIKGRGGNVIIDNAKIFAGNGIVLQAMINDDPFAMGAGPIVGVNDGAPPPEAPPGLATPEMMAKLEKPQSPDVNVSIKNTEIDGDYINSRSKQGDMSINLDNARITGTISSATQSPITGKMPDKNTFWQIGNVANKFGPSDGEHKTKVNLSNKSIWKVNKTSYIDSLNIDNSSKIIAPQGYTLSMEINGKAQKIKSGAYNGKITLIVQPAQ